MSGWAQFDASEQCEATVMAQDADLQCTMMRGSTDAPSPNPISVEDDTVVRTYSNAQFSGGAHFETSENCVNDNDIGVGKVLVNDELMNPINVAQAELTTFDFSVEAWGDEIADGPDDGMCADSNTAITLDGADFEGVFVEGGFFYVLAIPDAPIEVLNGYIDVAENEVVECYYGVFEDLPVGWTLMGVWGLDMDGIADGENKIPCSLATDQELAMHLVAPQLNDPEGDGICGTSFANAADPVPIIVTKTFIGRAYYTTVDRADFHVFTPGNCSGIPIDPFGNLLGSNGLFRTVNAAQDTQFVIAPPFTSDALPHAFAWTAGYDLKEDPVKCTTRVQETHAPDGCTPLDPTGSNADGPYWEQTWDVGVTNLTFNIVNDCTEPTPEPTVAPTTDPKKPAAKPGAKKPSGGGSAAPKFTG